MVVRRLIDFISSRVMVRAIASCAIIARCVCVIVANLALLLLIRLLARHSAVQVPWWLEVALAGSVVLCGLIIALQQWVYWHHPAEQLMEMLPQARDGEVAIEELADIGGGLSKIVAEVQETLRELRRQRAEIARAEAETKQRLANRTDALERSLGVMRQQATRDGLTGVFNRRCLDEALPKIISQAREERWQLTVMMIDVDNFKPLNDILGHAAGDELLRSLGQVLRSTLRDVDQAFRYGGDEFVIVMRNTSREQAEALCNRLMELVDAMTRYMPLPKPPRLSIGVFCPKDLNKSAEEMLKEADRLLYEIKSARKSKGGTRAA